MRYREIEQDSDEILDTRVMGVRSAYLDKQCSCVLGRVTLRRASLQGQDHEAVPNTAPDPSKVPGMWWAHSLRKATARHLLRLTR